ncbi:10566_t:CDS:10 [Diversispora eburnea]|uniref:10566_t:CDS:1 n=1 Tax=Diversispora eburnea TaxID=1213867 RepID=A0A9N9FTV3_9GLOM|nr:10566_t:CDS:10 [Diversispora eburnea]
MPVDDNRDDNNDYETTRERIINTFAGFSGNTNNMIGSGVFSAPGIVLQKVGSPWTAIILWIVGAIMNVCGALTYVELGNMIQEGGGEIGYLREGFPVPYRPVTTAAVLQGATNFFLFTVIDYPEKCEYDEYFHPKGWSREFFISKIIGLILLAIVTTSKLNTEESIWSMGFEKPTPAIIASALVPIIFAGNGWNNLNFALDEFQNPARNLVHSSCANILTNVALFSTVKKSDAIKTRQSFSLFLARSFAKEIADDKLARALSFFAIISALGAVSAFVWSSGSRIIVAASRLNYIPFLSGKFVKWSTKFDTPHAALLTQRIRREPRTFKVWVIVPITFILISLFVLSFSGIHVVPVISNNDGDCGSSSHSIAEYWKILATLLCLVIGAVSWNFLYYIPWIKRGAKRRDIELNQLDKDPEIL